MIKLDFNQHKALQERTDAALRDICYHPIDGGPPLQCITVGNEYSILRDHLGDLQQNQIQNFWTYGRYAMQDVLKYVLLQTGPAEVSACTWAITTQSVETILQLRERGYINSFRLWIDPRVKVRNPPKRRHTTKNFAECCAIEIANRLGLHFYPDAVTTQSKQRINPVFELHAEIKEPIVIIFDDIITTGSTLRATGKLFQDKSVIYTVGIYNG